MEAYHQDLRLVAVGQSLIMDDLRGFPAQKFPDVKKCILGADSAFTNYEGTIRGSYCGRHAKSGTVHVSDPIVLDALQDRGFNTLSLSNKRCLRPRSKRRIATNQVFVDRLHSSRIALPVIPGC